MRFCVGCRASHPLSKFYTERSLICRDADRDRKLRQTFSLTLDEYNAMLAAQNFGCSLCGKTPEENGRALAVDHSHSCTHREGIDPKKQSCGRCIRGLICNTCNLRLTETLERELLSMDIFTVSAKYGDSSFEVRAWKYLVRFQERIKNNIPPFGLDHFPDTTEFPNTVRRFREDEEEVLNLILGFRYLTHLPL